MGERLQPRRLLGSGKSGDRHHVGPDGMKQEHDQLDKVRLLLGELLVVLGILGLPDEVRLLPDLPHVQDGPPLRLGAATRQHGDQFPQAVLLIRRMRRPPQRRVAHGILQGQVPPRAPHRLGQRGGVKPAVGVHAQPPGEALLQGGHEAHDEDEVGDDGPEVLALGGLGQAHQGVGLGGRHAGVQLNLVHRLLLGRRGDVVGLPRASSAAPPLPRSRLERERSEPTGRPAGDGRGGVGDNNRDRLLSRSASPRELQRGNGGTLN
mmetsp:Transcript_31273/g.81153  ORF Transcript_31273/g.81153 Transcript_31273/m.81153 type:complete len:264 (-) Transcript_31273:421-1212(-)